jgi:hypothetical protein
VLNSSGSNASASAMAARPSFIASGSMVAGIAHPGKMPSPAIGLHPGHC